MQARTGFSPKGSKPDLASILNSVFRIANFNFEPGCFAGPIDTNEPEAEPGENFQRLIKVFGKLRQCGACDTEEEREQAYGHELMVYTRKFNWQVDN